MGQPHSQTDEDAATRRSSRSSHHAAPARDATPRNALHAVGSVALSCDLRLLRLIVL